MTAVRETQHFCAIAPMVIASHSLRCSDRYCQTARSLSLNRA